jgi:hypothetical protein
MIEDHEVAAMMRQYGGSFVRGLGELWLLADSSNRQIIKVSWPEYWSRYTAMVEAAQKAEVRKG